MSTSVEAKDKDKEELTPEQLALIRKGQVMVLESFESHYQELKKKEEDNSAFKPPPVSIGKLPAVDHTILETTSGSCQLLPVSFRNVIEDPGALTAHGATFGLQVVDISTKMSVFGSKKVPAYTIVGHAFDLDENHDKIEEFVHSVMKLCLPIDYPTCPIVGSDGEPSEQEFGLAAYWDHNKCLRPVFLPADRYALVVDRVSGVAKSLPPRVIFGVEISRSSWVWSWFSWFFCLTLAQQFAIFMACLSAFLVFVALIIWLLPDSWKFRVSRRLVRGKKGRKFESLVKEVQPWVAFLHWFVCGVAFFTGAIGLVQPIMAAYRMWNMITTSADVAADGINKFTKKMKQEYDEEGKLIGDEKKRSDEEKNFFAFTNPKGFWVMLRALFTLTFAWWWLILGLAVFLFWLFRKVCVYSSNREESRKSYKSYRKELKQEYADYKDTPVLTKEEVDIHFGAKIKKNEAKGKNKSGNVTSKGFKAVHKTVTKKKGGATYGKLFASTQEYDDWVQNGRDMVELNRRRDQFYANLRRETEQWENNHRGEHDVPTEKEQQDMINKASLADRKSAALGAFAFGKRPKLQSAPRKHTYEEMGAAGFVIKFLPEEIWKNMSKNKKAEWRNELNREFISFLAKKSRETPESKTKATASGAAQPRNQGLQRNQQLDVGTRGYMIETPYELGNGFVAANCLWTAKHVVVSKKSENVDAQCVRLGKTSAGNLQFSVPAKKWVSVADDVVISRTLPTYPGKTVGQWKTGDIALDELEGKKIAVLECTGKVDFGHVTKVYNDGTFEHDATTSGFGPTFNGDGSSGSPILLDGRVIGMHVQGGSRRDGVANVGFLLTPVFKNLK